MTQTCLGKGATREIGDPWGLVDETKPKHARDSAKSLLPKGADGHTFICQCSA